MTQKLLQGDLRSTKARIPRMDRTLGKSSKKQYVCSKRRKLVFLEGLSFEQLYCVSVRISSFVYCTGTGVVLKPNLWPNVYSGLKNYHPGILGVKNKPELPKNPREILGNTIDSWKRR